MKAHWKVHRLLLGAIAVAAFAALAASPAMARIGVSHNVKVRAHKRAHRNARAGGVAALGAPASSGATPALKPEVPPGPKPVASSGCPSFNAYDNFKEAHSVTASIEETEPGTFNYIFDSLKKEEEVEGVPGLIKYCVYPPTAPDEIEAVFDHWIARQSANSPDFSFGRPEGNSTNLPLSGEPVTVGTATWKEGAPTTEDQKILLHINDREVCSHMYGGEDETCFVRPGELEEEEEKPVCDAGAGPDEFAYNALPFGFAKGCPPPPSLGYEANHVSEFGDEVGLAGTGTEITSATVDFQSFGCGESGHWNKGGAEACKTNSGETFTIPASGGDPAGVTLHLYEVEEPGAPFPDTVGTEIAHASNNEPIPFRPSASEECTESSGEFESGSRWKDPVTGMCLSSLSVPITFTFSPGEAVVSAGSQVIWTITFNTTHYGYHPIGTGAACATSNPGCGYDSLNVGAKTYPGAPYAGTDVNPAGVFINQTSEPSNLAEEMGWGDLTPLAQISTGP